ncbi:MAG: ribosomal protein S18-alanine N-acetyltransferase [Clostridia bacterium]|nr:ribosomal protein S18-alanine N-acetyltransferase [Clostridia bacterium]
MSLKNLEIKIADESHVKGICEIESEAFVMPWGELGMHRDICQNINAFYLVATDENNKPLGYVGYWKIQGEYGLQADITNVAVLKEERGKGIGDALITALVKHCDEEGFAAITLEVRVSNTPAINLYSKYGFISQGIRPGYYQDNKEDAMIMWRMKEEI